MSLSVRLANRIVRTACSVEAGKFWRLCHQMEHVQNRMMTAYLEKNERSAFGKTYGFSTIRSYRDFRQKIPVTDFSVYQPYIERLMEGAAAQLTDEDVQLLEPTSGSTTGSKLIPYTSQLQKEYMAAVKPWLADLYAHYPELKNGTSYWSISPVAEHEAGLNSAVPIGFEDDSGYFGPLARFLESIYPVPKTVRTIRDIESFRYITSLLLLTSKDLRLISVWNPSFLTILLEYIQMNGDRLADSLRTGQILWPEGTGGSMRKRPHYQIKPNPGQAEILKRLLDTSGWAEAVWPRLQVISCWTEAQAASMIPVLKSFFPSTPVQGKGLLATEGILSFPVCRTEGSVLAYRSHFFEFLNSEEEPIAARDLKEGEEYTPLITTGGGLYRYRLGDIVQVTGFFNGLPKLRFLGRENTCDVAGEKVSEIFISKIIEDLFSRDAFSGLLMAAPTGSASAGFRYVLICQMRRHEAEDTEWLKRQGRAFERSLCANFHYAYARKLGQLKSAMILPVVDNGLGRFQEFLMKNGMRAGDIKPVSLYRKTNIHHCFSKEFKNAYYPD